MHDKHYVWLGSRRAVRRNSGNKAALLDRAANAGLPVPAGVVLLDNAWQEAVAGGLVTVAAGQVVLNDAAGLHALLLESGLQRSVAVRSAFSAEDSAARSLAGYFTTRLHVDPTDPDAFSAALADVWSSAERLVDDALRRDVLIMEMVDAAHAGVAFTQPGFQDDLVNFTSGTGDALVSGAVAGEALLLPQLQSGERAAAAAPFARRLQRLLRGVRRTFGAAAWDIEWADDGAVCWLLQVRPITAPPRRNEAFTFANIREIMPDPPSAFMTGIVAECAPGLFAYYRRFDRHLPADRPLIEVFAGRPLFNITLLGDMVRRWGLPTRLVTGAIGGSAEQEAGLRPRRMLRHAPALLRQGWDQLNAVRGARRDAERLQAGTRDLPETFNGAIDRLNWLFTGLVTRMFSLTAAMSAPLLILRLAGTLGEHSGRHRSISTAMETDMEPLRRYVGGHPELRDTLRQGELPADAGFLALWEPYLARHGHRGIYESDIARPRYAEAPAPLLRMTLSAPNPPAPPLPATLRGQLTLPIWWYLRRVLAARESFRYEAMRGYQPLRERLLSLAGAAAASGRLPAATDLWLLTPAEARTLDHGQVFDADFISQRRAEQAALSELLLPDILRRFDDLEQYRSPQAVAQVSAARLRGVSLTAGVVEGRAWVLREPAGQLPDGYLPQNTILVARSVDAGWIPTFNLVCGVVVEIGGDLSHGSIILRELRKPAVTNVSGATAAIAPGALLRLQAGAGVVELRP